MIITMLIIYLMGIIFYAGVLAEQSQIKLLKKGSFYKFSTLLLHILKNPKKELFLSWFGVIFN